MSFSVTGICVHILQACKLREIKLSGVLAAAGIIAARSSKELPEGQWEKYSVTTLVDCHPFLDPPLHDSHIGFYHSAIINTHYIKGGEDIPDLAKRTYGSFENAKKFKPAFRRHGRPELLVAHSTRKPWTDTMWCHELGLEDMFGCASVHGIVPSNAIFHKVQDGELDFAGVYPPPLLLREQISKIVDNMKTILAEGFALE